MEIFLSWTQEWFYLPTKLQLRPWLFYSYPPYLGLLRLRIRVLVSLSLHAQQHHQSISWEEMKTNSRAGRTTDFNVGASVLPQPSSVSCCPLFWLMTPPPTHLPKLLCQDCFESSWQPTSYDSPNSPIPSPQFLLNLFLILPSHYY